MRSPIVYKLSLWIAIISICSACVSVYFTYSNGRDLLINTAKERLSTASQVIAQRYNFFMQETAKSLLFIARLPAIQEMAQTKDPAKAQLLRNRLGYVFTQLINTHSEYFQVRFIDAGHYGRELVRADRTPQGAEVIAAADLQEKGHFPYVYNTLKIAEGKVFVSAIHLNKERGMLEGYGKPRLILATPVFDAEHQLLGLVVINIDFERMFALIQKDLPSNLTLVATNSQGDYLIHPDPEKTFGFDKGLDVRIQESVPESQKIYSGEEPLIVTRTQDLRHPEKAAVLALVKVPFEYTTLQKYLVIGLCSDLDNVFADATQLGFQALRLSLLFSLLLVIISYLLAQQISKPLQLIARTFGRFREGDPIPELNLNSDDEMGLLANNFSTMAKSINLQLHELKIQRQYLQQAAYHDPLTHLPNRLLLDDRIEQALVIGKRDKLEVAVMLVDLDDFKPVNDLYGHDIGDRLLQEVSARMLGCIRESDTLARFGGDEFMVILSQRDQQQASLNARQVSRQVAEKIRHALQQPFKIDNFNLKISCSLGISLYPDDAQDKETLIKNADLAMYYAKSSGRNNVKFFSEIIVD